MNTKTLECVLSEIRKSTVAFEVKIGQYDLLSRIIDIEAEKNHHEDLK